MEKRDENSETHEGCPIGIVATLDLQDRIPSHPVHDLLTLIYWQQGDWDKALNELKLKLEWQKDDVLLEALEAGMATTGPHGAIHAVAETMVKYSESRSTNLFRIGEAFALAGDADNLIEFTITDVYTIRPIGCYS